MKQSRYNEWVFRLVWFEGVGWMKRWGGERSWKEKVVERESWKEQREERSRQRGKWCRVVGKLKLFLDLKWKHSVYQLTRKRSYYSFFRYYEVSVVFFAVSASSRERRGSEEKKNHDWNWRYVGISKEKPKSELLCGRNPWSVGWSCSSFQRIFDNLNEIWLATSIRLLNEDIEGFLMIMQMGIRNHWIFDL